MGAGAGQVIVGVTRVTGGTAVPVIVMSSSSGV